MAKEKQPSKLLSWSPKQDIKEEKKEEVAKKPVTKKEAEEKTMATFYLRNPYLTKIKRAVYWDREDSQAIVIEKALDLYFQDRQYEPTPAESKDKQ